jgi:rhamnogalacturonyl hydrolase YesR
MTFSFIKYYFPHFYDIGKIWKQIVVLLAILLAGTTISVNAQIGFSNGLDKNQVETVVNAVAKWQIKAYPDMDKQRYWKSHGDLSWENGVFLSALASWAEFTKDTAMIRWYSDIATKNNYGTKPTNSIYHADNFAVCMMYMVLFNKNRADDILAATRARMDYVINYPSQTKLYKDTPKAANRWSWADALYMAPPAFTNMSRLTGDTKYIDFMDKEFWNCYDLLFSKEDSLFFRDSSYFNKLEKNNKKVFWGRGNAWVIAGLCQILENMPYSYSSRYRFESLFKVLVDRLAKLQDKEGYWHASLLDPGSYPNPETSSTGFITYAIWWGINHGLLDETIYKPYAVKGWQAIVAAVHPNGMLGWVQPIGSDPQKVTKDMTEVYGAGAMMLLGEEILKYLDNKEEIFSKKHL